MKNGHHDFSEAKVTSSDGLFCLTNSTNPKYSQFSIVIVKYVKQIKVADPRILRANV